MRKRDLGNETGIRRHEVFKISLSFSKVLSAPDQDRDHFVEGTMDSGAEY